MTPSKYLASRLVTLLVLTAMSLQAQVLYYKANNNDSLDLGTSWTNALLTGTAPSAADTAIWDLGVATAANCTNVLGGNGPYAWGGIQVLDPAAFVKVMTNGSTHPTLNLDALGVDLNEPMSTQDFWLGLDVTTTADQLWAMRSGRTFIIGDTNRNVQIQNNVGVLGHLTFITGFRVRAGGTLFVTNSATTIEPAANALTSAQLLIGYDAAGGTVVQTAGAVKVKRTDGTTGSPNAGFIVGSQSSAVGTYTITGGLLADVNTGNSSYFALANGANSSGTLNVDGGGAVQALGLRLGNANNTVAVVNLTNGSIALTGTGSAGEVDIGRNSTAGTIPGPSTLNVYGGTFSALGTVAVPHGNGPGFVNLYGGSMLLGGSLNVPDSTSTNAGIVTINGGSLTITNSLNLPSSSSANASGLVSLNGGTLTLNAVAHPGTAAAALVLNGGTLRGRQNSTTFIAGAVPTLVTNGGAIVDTAGFNLTVPAALQHASSGATDGGLTKLGSGTLTLSGANSYNGPTTLNGGALYLYTTNFAGGALSVSNTALLHLILGSAGSTLNCASLSLGTLGASSGGVLTNEFDLNGFANPAIPIINTPSLAAAGTVYVNVTATGLGVGTYHLIQYSGSISGGDYTFVAGIVSGAVGYVTNNTATHFIDLVVASLPSLVWRAQVNTNWDTTTANWVDLSSGLSVTYPNGASVLFDDSASNGLVFATGVWAPASAELNNSAKDYTFTGVGHITGSTGLTKAGAGTVLMALTNNDYSGDTILSNGVFKAGAVNVIPNGTGKGDLTLEGTLDLNGTNVAVNGLTGYNGLIDNSGAGAATLTMGNGGGNGLFAGQITNSGGPLSLTISGGNFLLLGKNGYAGGTTSRGALQLAYEQSIGIGPLSVQGSLLWNDTAAHTLTNPLTITGGTTFGAGTNGPLTVPGTVNLGGGGRSFTCNTDVLLPQGATNGGFTAKAGTGTLTVKNFAGPDWVSGSFALNGGTLVLDNAAAVEHTNNFRIQSSVANGLARLVLTNGASLSLADGPTSNFRFGDGGAADGTNELDLAAALNVVAYAGSNNKFQMGSGTDPSGYNVANLLPGGVLQVRQVLDLAPASISIFNFDGGTLMPNTNDFAGAFMTNIDYCYVLDRGAVIDTAGWDATIVVSMQAGGSGVGGLTKHGAGMLRLNGFNSFTGLTLVSAGGLGGVGGLSGPVTIAGGATLAPGAAGTLGNLTINGVLTLAANSTTVIRLNTGQYDGINGLSLVNYGGTLVVTNVGVTSPALGDVYYLFSSSAYAGSFASLILPPLSPGLGWNLARLKVDGTIQVVNVPGFTALVPLGGNQLVFSGTNGTPFGNYYVLASTNVASPVASWTPVATNMFDDLGNFSFTNTATPSVPHQFFIIQVP